ncbi:unnamed protein product [Moneuplotes crassus]|uniref:Exonuclease 1 n=1 Tax=Euplotes crassus TaxID=5936 RepID=A0AAD1U6K3_EUPCR|nr:unnamed protein product [Moneuplotes crassus]
MCLDGSIKERTTVILAKVSNTVSKLRMLKEYKIKPIFVFDGAPIPVKSRIQEIRAKIRLKSREKVARLLREGNNEAAKKYGESFTITPYLVQKLYKVIKNLGCKCIVAPYEADAQLAYLFKTRQADVVFTEDSDLIAYGVTKLFYKLDNDGKGYEINMEGLFHEDFLSNEKQENIDPNLYKPDKMIQIDLCEEPSEAENSMWFIESQRASQSILEKEPTEKIPIFSKDKFLLICILAGCDYLEPIKGIGFKTAYKLLTQYPTVEKAIMSIMAQKKYTVPQGYLENFKLAVMTFLFQIVYDPVKEVCLNLTDPKENKQYGELFLNCKNQDFLGQMIPKEFAKDICACQIDIRTKKPFDLDFLLQEYCEVNNPVLLISSSEDEEKSLGLMEISDFSNLTASKRRQAPVRRKFSFNLGKTTCGKKRKRIPSPFRDKFCENVRNSESYKKMKFNKNTKNKRFRQLLLTDKALSSNKSDSDEDLPSNSLMAMFKRAKRSEEIAEKSHVVIPKLQTIKKKTFMSSIMTRPDQKDLKTPLKPIKMPKNLQRFSSPSAYNFRCTLSKKF